MALQAKERRRRTPEEAEAEILDAAEAFLRTHPFRDLTIDGVMDATGLSRPSFYVYFRDRHAFALSLLDRTMAKVYEGANEWFHGEGEGMEELEAAILGGAKVWAEHGRMLRAIADAASDDAEVERAYSGVVQGFIDASVLRIERENRRGRASVADPVRTATVLVWMNERVFSVSFGHGQGDDAEGVATALFTVWSRAIYDR